MGFVMWSLVPSRSGCKKYGELEAKGVGRFRASSVIRFELMQYEDGKCALYARLPNPPSNSCMLVHIETFQKTRLKTAVDAAAEWLDARGLAERQETKPNCCQECGDLIEEDWRCCAFCGAVIHTIRTKGDES